jgi:alpha-glucosidase
MVGRYHGSELTSEVAREVRSAVDGALLVAEHGHDFRPDLAGDGWHGVMNYAGFLRPVWSWLRGDALPEHLERQPWGDVPAGLPRLAGGDCVATMRAFRAGIPWSSVLHSWVLLDSHDTARFRTVAGTRERQLLGVGLQMTTPGVPMVFAGDELGLEGAWGEDGRRTMPWDAPESWDTELLDAYRELIALRRSSDALARGGIRYVHVDDDTIAYLRETRDERVLCVARRADGGPVALEASSLDAGELVTLAGEDAEVREDAVVLPGAGPAFHAWRIE